MSLLRGLASLIAVGTLTAAGVVVPTATATTTGAVPAAAAAAPLSVPGTPTAVAASSDGSRLYVASATGPGLPFEPQLSTLTVVDTGSATQLAQTVFAVGFDDREIDALTVSTDGSTVTGVHVGVGDEVEQYWFDANGVRTADSGRLDGYSPVGLALSQDGATSWFPSAGTLYTSTPAQGPQPLLPAPTPSAAPFGTRMQQLAAHPDNGMVYLVDGSGQQVVGVDTDGPGVLATVALGAAPAAVAVSGLLPGGRFPGQWLATGNDDGTSSLVLLSPPVTGAELIGTTPAFGTGPTQLTFWQDRVLVLSDDGTRLSGYAIDDPATVLTSASPVAMVGIAGSPAAPWAAFTDGTVGPLSAPAVVRSPADTSVVSGQPVTLTTSASGSPLPAVQWQSSTDGGTSFTDVAGATASTLTTSPTAPTSYRAVLTNALGTVTTAAAAVQVLPAPVDPVLSVLGPDGAPLSGPVDPGETLVYSIDLDNTGGTAAAPVDLVDDLTGVLDDAVITQVPQVVAGTGITVGDVRDGTFPITGTVQPGSAATVQIGVRVQNPDPGDRRLTNVVRPAGLPTPSCSAGPSCSDVPVASSPFSVQVSAIPDNGYGDQDGDDDGDVDTVLQEGDRVTYSVYLENIVGSEPVDVLLTSDLTDVVDDARVVTGPSWVGDPGVVVGPLTDTGFALTGTLGARSGGTVSWTVQVDHPDTGNHVLNQFVVGTGASAPATCDPQQAPPNVLCSRLTVLEVTASVDVGDGTPVTEGQQLTYTLTFDNTLGTDTAHVDYRDDRTDVLDQATVVVEATPGAGLTVGVSQVSQPVFSITGSIASGSVSTVSSTVQVTGIGNGTLRNYAVPAGSAPPGSCVPTDPSCTSNPVKQTVTAVFPGVPASLPLGSALPLTVSLPTGATGTVTFSATGVSGAVVGATVPLGTSTVTDGVATVTPTLADLGGLQLSAAYSGDNTHLPATAAGGTVQVTAPVGSLVVAQFRQSGPAGAVDAYLQLTNALATPLPLVGWRLASADGAWSVTLPAVAPTLAPGQSYLVAGSGWGGTADLTVAGGLGSGGFVVEAPDTAGTTTDAVTTTAGEPGFSPLPAFSGAPPTADAAWVRHRSGGGALAVTGDAAADFTLVSTAGGDVGGLPSAVGSTRPDDSGSPRPTTGVASGLLDPTAAVSAAPNRLVLRPPGSPAALVVRRTLTNTTGAPITAMRVRIVALSQVDGRPGPVSARTADLRWAPPATASGPVVIGGQPVAVIGLTPDPGTGAGLNATATVPLPAGGLAPGGSVAADFTFVVRSGGTFWFVYAIESG